MAVIWSTHLLCLYSLLWICLLINAFITWCLLTVCAQTISSISIISSLCRTRVHAYLHLIQFFFSIFFHSLKRKHVCLTCSIIKCLILFFSLTVSLRPTMTQWRVKVPSPASPHPTWCPLTPHCIVCPLSLPLLIWARALSLYLTYRVTLQPEHLGTHCPALPCCPHSVPPLRPHSKSAPPSTSSSPCTRAHSSTSQSACSRSSHSQSSLTRWASRPHSTPRDQASRYDRRKKNLRINFFTAHNLTSSASSYSLKWRDIQLSSGVWLQHAVMRCDVFDSGQRRARLLCCFVRWRCVLRCHLNQQRPAMCESEWNCLILETVSLRLARFCKAAKEKKKKTFKAQRGGYG